jgi:hypothetical protein
LHPEGGFFRSSRGEALVMRTVNVVQCHIAPIPAPCAAEPDGGNVLELALDEGTVVIAVAWPTTTTASSG